MVATTVPKEKWSKKHLRTLVLRRRKGVRPSRGKAVQSWTCEMLLQREKHSQTLTEAPVTLVFHPVQG